VCSSSWALKLPPRNPRLAAAKAGRVEAATERRAARSRSAQLEADPGCLRERGSESERARTARRSDSTEHRSGGPLTLRPGRQPAGDGHPLPACGGGGGGDQLRQARESERETSFVRRALIPRPRCAVCGMRCWWRRASDAAHVKAVRPCEILESGPTRMIGGAPHGFDPDSESRSLSLRAARRDSDQGSPRSAQRPRAGGPRVASAASGSDQKPRACPSLRSRSPQFRGFQVPEASFHSQDCSCAGSG
jgi:hypothetical protein